MKKKVLASISVFIMILATAMPTMYAAQSSMSGRLMRAQNNVSRFNSDCICVQRDITGLRNGCIVCREESEREFERWNALQNVTRNEF